MRHFKKICHCLQYYSLSSVIAKIKFLTIIRHQLKHSLFLSPESSDRISSTWSCKFVQFFRGKAEGVFLKFKLLYANIGFQWCFSKENNLCILWMLAEQKPEDEPRRVPLCLFRINKTPIVGKGRVAPKNKTKQKKPKPPTTYIMPYHN